MSDVSKPLRSHLKKLGSKFGEPSADAPPPTLESEPIVHELIYSMLLWEAGAAKARAALDRVSQAFVDFNELRICLPDELASVLGPRYPRVDERCERLRSSLGEVYLRANGLKLTALTEMSKRDAKVFLESLPGVPQFVAARVCLLALGAHTFPLDDRLFATLVRGGVLEPDEQTETAAGRIERSLRSGEAQHAYALVEASDEHGGRSGGRTSGAGRSSGTKRAAATGRGSGRTAR